MKRSEKARTLPATSQKDLLHFCVSFDCFFVEQFLLLLLLLETHRKLSYIQALSGEDYDEHFLYKKVLFRIFNTHVMKIIRFCDILNLSVLYVFIFSWDYF